jgi:uncharacterized protein (DUF2141 family)
MKQILFGLLALMSSLTSAQELKVLIKNVKGDEGTILVALYNSKDQFMKTQFKIVKMPSVNGQVVAVFQDIVPGTYAISVMHDSNNDNELDKNAIGIPKEGVGFSNDAKGTFGPPDFKPASFQYPASKEMVINLKYY